jgi:hypothetical protein
MQERSDDHLVLEGNIPRFGLLKATYRGQKPSLEEVLYNGALTRATGVVLKSFHVLHSFPCFEVSQIVNEGPMADPM